MSFQFGLYQLFFNFNFGSRVLVVRFQLKDQIVYQTFHQTTLKFTASVFFTIYKRCNFHPGKTISFKIEQYNCLNIGCLIHDVSLSPEKRCLLYSGKESQRILILFIVPLLSFQLLFEKFQLVDLTLGYEHILFCAHLLTLTHNFLKFLL